SDSVLSTSGVRVTSTRNGRETVCGRAPLADDPFRVATAAPAHLRSIPISQLTLSTRCRNALSKNGISDLGDLVGGSLKTCLQEWRNFGVKCAAELADQLGRAIDAAVSHRDDGACLIDAVVEEISHLPRRNQEAVRTR